LIALAAVVVPLFGNNAATGRETVTWTNMTSLRKIILGQYRLDMKDVVLAGYRGQPSSVLRPAILPRPGYYSTHNAVPPASSPRLDKPQLRYLFVNPGRYVPDGDQTLAESTITSRDPSSQVGWSGPYALGPGSYRVNVACNFTRDFGEDGDPATLDGWNSPIV